MGDERVLSETTAARMYTMSESGGGCRRSGGASHVHPLPRCWQHSALIRQLLCTFVNTHMHAPSADADCLARRALAELCYQRLPIKKRHLPTPLFCVLGDRLGCSCTSVLSSAACLLALHVLSQVKARPLACCVVCVLSIRHLIQVGGGTSTAARLSLWILNQAGGRAG
jgi:hypothetical protein